MDKCSLLTAPALAALLTLLAGAAPGRAETINIDFDLSGSTISILGGVLDIPPDGSITASNAKLVIDGAGIATPSLGGQAELFGLTIAGTAAKNIAGVANVTGDIHAIRALNKPVGTLSAGGGSIFFPGTLMIRINADFDCSGTGCGAITSFPLNILATQTLTLFGSLPVAGLSTVGAASFGPVLFSASVSGFTVQMTLVGQEIAREFAIIPEPSPLSLLGLGLLGLAAPAVRARRRR